MDISAFTLKLDDSLALALQHGFTLRLSTVPMTASIGLPVAVLVSSRRVPDIDKTRGLTFGASSRATMISRSPTERARQPRKCLRITSYYAAGHAVN
jgi:hypothetical protein